jgi:hypothetical protein
MKIQDFAFLFIFLLLLVKRNPKLTVVLGLLALFFSIPLFSFWIFFTAERLTFYAGGFFLLAIIQFVFEKDKK